jgi:hypothetical protein
MRAGLFLEGLSRSHSVHVVVVPVLGSVAPPDTFVSRLAYDITILSLDSPSDLVATLAAEVAVIHIMRVDLAPLLDIILNADVTAKLVIDIDDFESFARRRGGQTILADHYERLEAQYLPIADHVITCSPADATLLADRYHLTSVTAVPNAVRLPTDEAMVAPDHDLLFVGNLSYVPNIAGSTWLCRQVLPRLSGVTTAIVGRQPPPEVRGLASESVGARPTGR